MRRSAAGRAFHRTPHGVTVADETIQTLCAVWDLTDCPITDARAERRDVHLLNERAVTRPLASVGESLG
jgi:hypothetical protein